MSVHIVSAQYELRHCNRFHVFMTLQCDVYAGLMVVIVVGAFLMVYNDYLDQRNFQRDLNRK